ESVGKGGVTRASGATVDGSCPRGGARAMPPRGDRVRHGRRLVPPACCPGSRKRRPGFRTVRGHGPRGRGLRGRESGCIPPPPPRGGHAMKAAVMEAIRQPLIVGDVPDPSPPDNGVVVRVEANGICRSDWHLWTGDWSWLGIQV